MFDRTLPLGAKKFKLFVAKSNEPAQQLYASVGFKPVSTIPGYYHQNDDAVVMETDSDLVLELQACTGFAKLTV